MKEIVSKLPREIQPFRTAHMNPDAGNGTIPPGGGIIPKADVLQQARKPWTPTAPEEPSEEHLRSIEILRAKHEEVRRRIEAGENLEEIAGGHFRP